MKTKGWSPWKLDWYSFCSVHRVHNNDYQMCQSGEWYNRWLYKIGRFVYVVSPQLWIWLVNFSNRGKFKSWFRNITLPTFGIFLIILLLLYQLTV